MSVGASILLAAVLGGAFLPAPRAAAKSAARCPEATRPIRTVDPLHPWACVLNDERYRDGIECPAGSRPITTVDTFEPFKCAVNGVELVVPRGICPPRQHAIPTADPTKDYECEKVGDNFRSGPRCPKGTRPVPTPDALRPFRCVAGKKAVDPEPTAEPDFGARGAKRDPKGRPARRERAPLPTGPTRPKAGRCPEGAKKVLTENPFAPVQCLPKTSKRPQRMRFEKYRTAHEIAFQYPKDWHLTDAWRDEEPSIYILLGSQQDGRPVSLSITRHRRGDAGFLTLESRIWREQDWHGSKETGRAEIAGLPAVRLAVERESEMAFVETSDGYYVLAYSAPAELFDRYAPAYHRLLKTFRTLNGGTKK
ncbi:MAG: hypothetical protein ABII00_05810 [Elusimicrobiota bacterium]